MLIRRLLKNDFIFYPAIFLKWLVFFLEIVFLVIPIATVYFLVKGKNEESQLKFNGVLQRYVRRFTHIYRYFNVKIHNDYNEQFDRPAVIICNHQSLIEILTLLSLSPKVIILAKEAFGRNPISGAILKLADFYPVSDGYEQVTERLRDKVEQGWSIVVFPEGTRTKDGNIQRFHRGAFYIAEQFNLDIVPCYVENSFQLMPKGRYFPHRGTVHFHILPRVKSNDTFFGTGYRKRTKNFERYYRELNTRKPSVHIIGAGLGGLITGALLTRQGYRVCMVEKNHIIGGGLQSFVRDGELFNTGMHIFGGMQEKGTLRRIFDYLGTTDKLHLIQTPEEAQDIVYLNGRTFRMPRGKDAAIKYLSGLYPAESEGLKNYYRDLYLIADSFDLYRLHYPQPHPEVQDLLDMTAAQLIERHIQLPELRQLLCYNDVLIGYRPDKTPVGMFAMIQLHYLEGEYRMQNGSIEIADALADVIRSGGGLILNDQTVTHLSIERKQVHSLQTDKGLDLQVEKTVSAITPQVLLKMTDQPILRNLAYKRINEMQHYDSGFIVFIKLKPNTFKYIESTVFIPTETKDTTLASHLLMVTKNQTNGYASNMEILVPCHYEEFEQWANTTIGQRPQEYIDKKNRLAKEIVSYVATFYPDLPDSIDKYYTSSPLTIRDYYNNPRGSIFGQQGIFAPLYTHIDNLFLTGQANIYHGMCGVPLTAIRTTQIITGNDILNEL